MQPIFYIRNKTLKGWEDWCNSPKIITFVQYQIENQMKINPNYKLHSIAGETIVVNQGTTGVDMTRIISLNASAKLLYETLAGKEFSLEDAAGVLVTTYGISQEQALKDAQVWVEALQKCKVIE